MRKRPQLRLTLLFALSLGLSTVAHAEKIADIRPSGYVIDLAKVIDAETTQRVEALCTEVEQKTGAQIAVVTVRSLEGETREDYAVDLFKHLGIGHKDDRGVLLLLAPPERQYKIEVGYGLEPIINDARAGDIGREMVPLLRQNNYSGAVLLAVGRLAQLIAADKGVKLDGQVALPAPRREPLPSIPWWLPWLIILIIFLIGRGLGGGSGSGGTRRRSGMGGLWWAGALGGMGGGWGGSSGGYSGGGFGGFGGGSSGGGGAGGSW
ncbi:MAG TPA: TPM domain-containing protein [Terriglobales bacterium]|nr:TPM domain-containing protein [Terriglobales bacterium]